VQIVRNDGERSGDIAAAIPSNGKERHQVIGAKIPPGAGGWQDFQDRIRDASLSVILVLEIFIVFVSAPLAVKGLPLARVVVDILTWTTVVLIVLLSHRWGAIVMIIAGLALLLTDFLNPAAWSPVVSSVCRAGGGVLEFSALAWVVAHAVFAPGRITPQRLQGSVVVYLNLGLIFASAYRLIGELNPTAFNNAGGQAAEYGTMLYFSLTTLTTTGYGDISPVDPFARGLANLEAVLGQFYLAITVARLVSLQIADRRD
jgi:hypothetical protein